MAESSHRPHWFLSHMDILTSPNEKKLVFKSIGTSRITSYQLKEMTLSIVACSSLREMNDTKHESKSRMSLLMCFLVWAKKTRWLQGFCLKARTTKQFCPHKTSTYSLELIKSIERHQRLWSYEVNLVGPWVFVVEAKPGMAWRSLLTAIVRFECRSHMWCHLRYLGP